MSFIYSSYECINNKISMEKVIMKLIEIILNKMIGIGKRKKDFMIKLFTVILSMYGKVNFASMSRYSGMNEKTFRRWFRKDFNFEECNFNIADTVIKDGEECVSAFDPSFLEKAGKFTHGLGKHWNSCASKVQKGIEICVAAVISVKRNSALTLSCMQTPSKEDIKAGKTSEEIDATRVDFYLSCISAVRDRILKFTKYMTVDGYFTKQKFINGLLLLGLNVIGKLRVDAHLKMIYTGPRRVGRGRPKKYKGKSKISELEGFSYETDVVCDGEVVKLYSGIFYCPFLGLNIKAIALVKENATCVLYSTDTALGSLRIYTYYKARYQIEFIFRDGKQHTGLADCQSRDKDTLHFHFNISLSALNLVKAEEMIDNDANATERPFSMASYKAINHNEMMIERFSSMLDLDLSKIKLNPNYNELRNYGVISY